MIINDHKVLSYVCERLKKNGHIIVLASGAFDLLHVGHIRYLEASKKEGSVLIVALNSDESVLLYKDAKVRQPLRERMEIIHSLRCVDIVTFFDEPTAHRIVDVIRPHIHSKGTDYSAETLPEYEYITGQGIKVVFVGDEKRHSSSKFKQNEHSELDQKY